MSEWVDAYVRYDDGRLVVRSSLPAVPASVEVHGRLFVPWAGEVGVRESLSVLPDNAQVRAALMHGFLFDKRDVHRAPVDTLSAAQLRAVVIVAADVVDGLGGSR